MPLNSSNWMPESVSPVDGALTHCLADADEDLKEKPTSKVNLDSSSNNNNNNNNNNDNDILWGEMCDTCADR